MLCLHGTRSSGVAIAVDVLGGPEDVGRVLAHEIGHFLGLFHTTDTSGPLGEPLTDTLECPLSRDADGDGISSVEECGDHGADNLMFWTFGAGDSLSAQQSSVIRGAFVLE
jgi:hypothetical protein